MKNLLYFAIGVPKEEREALDKAIANLEEFCDIKAIELDRDTMNTWYRNQLAAASKLSDSSFVKDQFEEHPEQLQELVEKLNLIKSSLENPSDQFGYFTVVNLIPEMDYATAKNMIRVAEMLGFVAKLPKNQFAFVDTQELARQAAINKIEGLKQHLALMEKVLTLFKAPEDVK